MLIKLAYLSTLMFPYVTSFKTEVHVLSKIIILIIAVVARIAYDKLSIDSPDSLTRANELLSLLKLHSHGNHNDKEGDYPFVECATMADDIKYIGGNWQSDWHFEDVAWFDKGGKPEDYPDFKADSKNLTSAIS